MITHTHDLTAWQIANLPPIDPARLLARDFVGGLRLQANADQRHFRSSTLEDDGCTIVAMEKFIFQKLCAFSSYPLA